MSDQGYWQYTGDGDEFLPGIPAQNIKDEEAEENGWEETLKLSKIYKHVSGDGQGSATAQGAKPKKEA